MANWLLDLLGRMQGLGTPKLQPEPLVPPGVSSPPPLSGLPMILGTANMGDMIYDSAPQINMEMEKTYPPMNYAEILSKLRGPMSGYNAGTEPDLTFANARRKGGAGGGGFENPFGEMDVAKVIALISGLSSWMDPYGQDPNRPVTAGSKMREAIQAALGGYGTTRNLQMAEEKWKQLKEYGDPDLYPDIGKTRTVNIGDQEYTQQHVGRGKWKTIGQGDRWQPRVYGSSREEKLDLYASKKQIDALTDTKSFVTPDGQRLSGSDIRGFYFADYNIPESLFISDPETAVDMMKNKGAEPIQEWAKRRFGVDIFPELNKETKTDSTGPVAETEEEYNAAPSGTPYRDPKDGKIYLKP